MDRTRCVTATNLLIFLIVLAYLLDRYVVPLPADYAGIVNRAEDMPRALAYILGFCGGRLTDLLALCGEGLRPGGGAFYRRFTVVFTHASLLHLAANVIPLAVIGNFVERRLGPALTAGVFFLVSFLESCITDPLYLLLDPAYAAELPFALNVGASSGVFGLMGAGLALCLLDRENWSGLKRSGKILLAVYGVLTTYLFGVGWSTLCHNVAFVLGCAAMAVLRRARPGVKSGRSV